MNSFISSFKPVLCALAIIAAIESAVMLMLHPSDAERSNYLAFNYLAPETGHRFIIHEKLKDYVNSSPDIIQIGDSSGFYGVNPGIVMSYLNGLSYVNLSCCANTGYEGYYSIADFMFRHNPHIKALVLYIGLDNLPRTDLLSGDTGAGALHAAFDSIWARFMPPSLALRWRIADAVYSLGGYVRPETPDNAPNDEYHAIAKSILAHHGWAREMDPRYVGQSLIDYWKKLCGEDDVLHNLDDERYYGHDLFQRRYSLTTYEFSHFAQLAALHGARFILMMQPLACGTAEHQFQKRLNDIQAFERVYPSATVIPAHIPFHWPKEDFTSLPHLRIGFEVANSHRIGRALARVLGISPPSALHEPATPIPLADTTTPAILQKDQFTRPEWKQDGVTVQTTPDSAAMMTESKQQGWHRIMLDTDKIRPGVPYIFSVIFKPMTNRSVKLEALDKSMHGKYGYASCETQKLVTLRYGDVIDADLETLPDGWFRCWASMSYDTNISSYSIAITSEQKSVYQGDGASGLLLRDMRIQPGGRLISTEKPASHFP